jgi:hypothetical protein
MLSYFDKRLNRKVLYNKLFSSDVPMKSTKMSSESTGSSDTHMLQNEHSRVRFLYAVDETFTHGQLVARDAFNNVVDLSKYSMKKEINFTSEASLDNQIKKIHKSQFTIVEYDYAADQYRFLDKWFAFLKLPLHKHTMREITNALSANGYKTTVIANVTSDSVNPLFKYQIDCVKIDSIKVP